MTNTPTLIKLANGSLLTTKDNTAFPISFAVAEIRDISKRKGSFSKSITIPGTKENNVILNNYYDINIQAGTFDINRITECSIIQNGVTILDNMVMQLVGVEKKQTNNNHDEEITYTVIIKDRIRDFFTTINQKKLTDLTGFSGISTSLTSQNILDSFDNTYLDIFKFVMPYKEESNGSAIYDIRDFQPAIFGKVYFDKIFSDAGFSYQWDEQFDELYNFDKLIIPYNGEEPKTGQNEEEAYRVEFENTTGITATTTYVKRSTIAGGAGSFTPTAITSSNQVIIKESSEIYDPQNLWNGSTGRYTTPDIASNTKIKYEVTVNYELYVENNTSGTVYFKSFVPIGNNQAPVNKNVNLIIEPVFKVTQLPPNSSISTIHIQSELPYSLTSGSTFATGNTTLVSRSVNLDFVTTGIIPNSITQYFEQIIINNSDDNSHIYSNFYTTSSPSWNTIPTGNARIKLRINSINVNVISLFEAEYGYNVPIILQSFIPKDIKQSDFISSIFKLYNLYCEIDSDNPFKLILKTRDKFYDEGKIEDWTTKLVKDKSQDIKFLPELQSKKITLSYKKDDNDVYNKEYYNQIGEVYGEVQTIFDNEYTVGEQRQELIFAPTPSENTSFGAILPMWNPRAPKNTIKLLYDGGSYETTKPYTIENYFYTASNNNPQTDITTYLYTGHWNKPFNPTFDLNFGQCEFYYRTDNFGSPTNNNIYNLYWRRTMSQINNGKLLTAYFNLNEYDIQKLKLSDKIRIDNSIWNINKIIDYDANLNQHTKVELISIDDRLAIPFKSKNIRRLNNTIPFITRLNRLTVLDYYDYSNLNLSNYPIILFGEKNNIGNSVDNGFILGNGNLISDDSFVFGDYNILSGDRNFVIGDNNFTSGDTRNSYIFGNNNTIGGELNDVFIFGSGISAGTENTAYFTNISIDGTLNGYPISAVTNQPLKFNTQTGGQTGITLSNRDELYYGNPGNNSFDISISTTTAATRGAVGSASFAIGTDTLAAGSNSIAGGQNTSSSGLRTVAFGLATTASGSDSFVYGNANTVAGAGSIAGGLSTNISMTSNYSVAIGHTCNVTGVTSQAFGKNTKAYGSYSFANGEDTIASGNHSFAINDSNEALSDNCFAGGAGSTSNGFGAFVFANLSQTTGDLAATFGDTNITTNYCGFSIGNNNYNAGTASFIGGVGNNIYGDNSFCFAQNSSLSGTNEVCFGQSLETNTDGSFTSGYGAKSRLDGEYARAYKPSLSFDGQYGTVDEGIITTNATPTDLTIGGIANNRFTIENNTGYRFKIVAIATRTDLGTFKEWTSDGLIVNQGGVTSMVGVSTTSTFAEASMASAGLNVSANNTNDYLQISVTGISATIINWYAKIDYTKITS